MISQIQEMLSYDFIQRTLIVGLFLAIASALVGVPLVLRRKSMLGDGLSHASFGAVAVAMFLGVTPTYFTIAIAIIFRVFGASSPSSIFSVHSSDSPPA